MPAVQPTDALMNSAGLRRTRATVALAALFKRRPQDAMSHTEVETALAQAGVEVNRVTVYRLLDRFVEAGLLQRHVDAGRVSRFARHQQAGVWAPRFECDDCHRQFRLGEASPSIQAAAEQMLKALESAGHEGCAVDISVRGRCAGCAHPAGLAR